MRSAVPSRVSRLELVIGCPSSKYRRVPAVTSLYSLAVSTARAIPPSTSTDATNSRLLSGSDSSTMPPRAASTGVDSCTSDALTPLKLTERPVPDHVAQPRRDRTRDHRQQHSLPARRESWQPCQQEEQRHRDASARSSGASAPAGPPRRGRSPSRAPMRHRPSPSASRPRAVAPPVPAARDRRGPPTATAIPAHCKAPRRSPLRIADTSMVTCTAPKRIRAPVPAVRLTYARLKAAA